MRRGRAQEAKEFTAIYTQYHWLVRSVLYQIVGRRLNDGVEKSSALDDLTQEAFIKIWRGYDRLRESNSIRPWIYRIATNTALDYLRTSSRGLEIEEEGTELADTRINGEEALLNRQIAELGLTRLSDEHRTVLVLAIIHERPLDEIAQILDVSVGTVKSRLYYAKESFRNYLSQLQAQDADAWGEASDDKRKDVRKWLKKMIPSSVS